MKDKLKVDPYEYRCARCTLMQLPPSQTQTNNNSWKKGQKWAKNCPALIVNKRKIRLLSSEKNSTAFASLLVKYYVLEAFLILSTYSYLKRSSHISQKEKKGGGWNLNFFWVSWTHWWCLMGGHNSHAFYFAFQISSYHLFHACAGGLLLSTYVPSRQHFLRTVFCPKWSKNFGRFNHLG